MKISKKRGHQKDNGSTPFNKTVVCESNEHHFRTTPQFCSFYASLPQVRMMKLILNFAINAIAIDADDNDDDDDDTDDEETGDGQQLLHWESAPQ